MPIWKGSTNAVLQNTERVKDPIGQNSITQTWVGPEDKILAIEASIIGPGWTSRRWHDGPVHNIATTYNDGTYQDKWTVTTETVDISIWKIPDVVAEMVASGFGAGYRQQIEDAISNGDSALNSSYNSYPYAQKVFFELSRGVENFEDEILVLKRTRTLPANWSTQMVLGSNKYIYNTAQLPIPGNVPFALPGRGLSGNPFPADPQNAWWGWRARGLGSGYDGRTAEQDVEFTLAAHSLLPYSVAPGGPFTG